MAQQQQLAVQENDDDGLTMPKLITSMGEGAPWRNDLFGSIEVFAFPMHRRCYRYRWDSPAPQCLCWVDGIMRRHLATVTVRVVDLKFGFSRTSRVLIKDSSARGNMSMALQPVLVPHRR